MGFDLFDLIGALVIGFIVGGIAKLIVRGAGPRGCLMTSLVGIAGSFFGAFLSRALFHRHVINPHNPLQPAGFIPSLIGAILILLIYHAILRRRR